MTTQLHEYDGVQAIRQQIRDLRILRKSVVAAQLIIEAGCNPFDDLVRIARKAEKGVFVGMSDEGEEIYKPNLNLAAKIYMDLASYCASKPKAFEEEESQVVESESHAVYVTAPESMPFIEMKSEDSES